MKLKLTEEISELLSQAKNWAELEVKYAKLTAAEKFTVLMTQLIIGFVALIIGNVVLVMLSLAVVELFKLIMSPALAYLSAAGCVVILLVIIFLCRKPLLLDPIARALTRLFFDRKP